MSAKRRLRVVNVVGARPNFVKIAPIVEEMRKYEAEIQEVLVHTGQHKKELSDTFMHDLGITDAADVYLDLGYEESTMRQTTHIMLEFERSLTKMKPDLVLVVGDVTSTLACALTAAKMQIPVAHVEAGLRSWDRMMPEELNRVLVDQMSELLFTSEDDAESILWDSGVHNGVHFVGNVMIDTLLKYKDKALALKIDKPKQYALLTLHRPSNVDHIDILEPLLATMREIAEEVPVLFPAHPRTKASIERFGLSTEGLTLLPPQGYLEFLHLQANAAFVMTDSGGVQEETTVLGVPCLTLRTNTERPITVSQGTNVIGGVTKASIERGMAELDRKTSGKQMHIPELWDGHTAERIVSVLLDWWSCA